MCSSSSSSQCSSISNPFFRDFPSAAAAGVLSASVAVDGRRLLAFEKGDAMPNVGTAAAPAGMTEKAEAAAVGEEEEEEKEEGGTRRRTERMEGAKWTSKSDQRRQHVPATQQQQQQQQQCCVVNPFRSEFESHSSLLPMSVVQPQSVSVFSFGTDFCQTIASSSVAKVLMDSGYRSTTSNSALEEELALAERQRRTERERKRAERKNHRKVPLSISTANADNSSVPNFLRRTCSTAVNGLSGLTLTNWAAGGGPIIGNADGGLKPPRRTKSVGTDRIPTANLYGTGWMVEADLSSSDDSPEGEEKRPKGVADDISKGGSVEIGDRRVPIQFVQHILNSNFCFISGLKTDAGHPVMTFPDSRTLLSFDDYQLLVEYLVQLNRVESISPIVEHRCQTNNSLLFNDGLLADGLRGGFVLVVDRRMDKWSSVRNLFSYLMCHFPEPVCLILLLKPEGVLQRAIEYAYRGLLDGNDKFKVVICQNSAELHQYVGLNSLTMDVGGTIQHNHLEWATNRVDIERMKNSARIIAESLSEFGKCLRETELPNDAQTTERILKLQQQERDAIKEDFRISIRKGMALLRQVRHNEQSDQLSPSRLQNVTAIERMINQLQDTERSFDTFWQKHRQRLLGCLELRQFEDEFRKLQNSFAKHMLHLEEHRQLGDSETTADGLAREHAQYGAEALNDAIRPCRALRKRGIELSAKGELSELLNCTEGSDSVGPKCEELARMAEVLGGAMARRGQMLEMNRKMHAQIAKANNWCRRGVQLLSVAPLDLLSIGCSNNLSIYELATARLEEFIAEGDTLKADVLSTASSCFPSTNSNSSEFVVAANPMLFSPQSADTCSLLTQVTERIDDIRRLSRARHEALKRLGEDKARQRDGTRPVQIVPPEKAQKRQQHNSDTTTQCPSSPVLRAENVLHGPCCSASSSSSKCLCSASTSSALSHSKSAVASSASAGFTDAIAMDNDGPRDGLDEETIPVKVAYVLEELLSTEKSYVCELDEIVKQYLQPFELLELSGTSQIPAALRGQSDILFGNIRELLDFHRSLLLPALQHSSNSVHGVSFVLNAQRHRLLALYRAYCRNKPISEALRRENSTDQLKFFAECQRRAGHLLPLSAYLLKPIQRITKYQLLLKELIRHCSDADQSQSVQAALAAMLDVLAQIDADMEHLHILGYPSDLRLLGALRLRSECEVYVVKRAKSIVSNGSSSVAPNRRNGAKGKHQKRHLFLFDGGVLFCKKRIQSVHISGEYYEHKLCIPIHAMAFSDSSRHSVEFFDIWDVHDNVSYAVKTVEESGRTKWLQRLAKLTILFQQRMAESAQEGIPMEPYPPWNNKSNTSAKTSRPQSWTTTSSSEDGGTGMALSGILSSRSSTASCSTAFEEKCPRGEAMEMGAICANKSSESALTATDAHQMRRKHLQQHENTGEKVMGRGEEEQKEDG